MEQQKKSELQTPPSHLNCVDETGNLHIQGDSGQSTAKERNFPQGNLQPAVATVEQLDAEEKTVHQETNEAIDGDTILEEDSKQEGSTQENVLNQKKTKTEKTPADSSRVSTVRQFTKFKGKSAAAVGPMPDNTNAELAWVTFNVVNCDITTRSHVSSYNTANQEDLETLTEAVAGEKLPAEELSKSPQVNNQDEIGFGGEASGEQLTDEEKNNRQVTWKTYGGDSSEDEDPRPAPVKILIQENKVQYMKIDEDKLQRALDSLGLGGSFIMPDADGLLSKGKKPLAHYGCANMNGPIYYKGNSSPARTIPLESVEGNTDAEQARAKKNDSTTKVTNNEDTTRSHAKSPDETDEQLYKNAIFRIGARDTNKNDIILIDAGKLPCKENFNNKKDFDNEARHLISYIEIFINAYVDTHHFVFIVHPGDDTKCRTKSSQMGKKIYKLLKENFSDRLAKCIIYKPQFKLRAALHLQRPFMKREMRQKIVMTKSQLNLKDKYGIPEAVIQCL